MLFQVWDNGKKGRREVNGGVLLLAAMGVVQDEIIDPAVLAKHRNATFRVWMLEDATHPLVHSPSDLATDRTPRIVLIYIYTDEEPEGMCCSGPCTTMAD
jgi:hypothetical protein